MLERYARTRDAIAALEQAFEELKTRDVLMQVARSDVLGERGKLLDAIFKLTPSMRFVAEVKTANKRLHDARTRGDIVKPVGLGRGSEPKTVGLGRGSR